MKATSYELKQRAFGSDHCDTSTTVTGVTVVPERRKNPEMTTNTGFEHCDTKKGRITVTVVPFSPSTVTDVKVVRNQGNMPQMQISNGYEHCDTQNSSLNVAGVPKLAYVPRRLRMSNLKVEELRKSPHKPETPVEPKHSAFIDFTPREKLPLKHDREARLIGHFCNLVIRRLAVCGSKVDEWQRIVQEYNSGQLVPELYQIRGERKERALRVWIDQYAKSDRDMFALLHKSKNLTHSRRVTETETKVLLSILLHPNQITIGSAINMLKTQARLGYFESPTSKPTLRRWCTEWMQDNLATWELTMRPNWYFDPQAALALLNLIEQGSYTSIRGIAADFGRSRQWVFVYLEALASMGVIGLNEHGYCVLTKKDINKVGIKIKRGILKELISHCAELRKQQRLQDMWVAWKLTVEVPEPMKKEMEAFDCYNQAIMQTMMDITAL